jgi:transcriptional regulator with XRE-family HTH domain
MGAGGGGIRTMPATTTTRVDPVKLRSTLAAREIAVKDFADACGIHRNSASNVLHGRRQPGRHVGRSIAAGLRELGNSPAEVGDDE